jgi:biotin carboxyl carrier protein
MPPVEARMDVAARDQLHGERLSVPERVIIAPCIGQFRPSAPEVVTAEGELIESGEVIGYIDSQGATVPVRSPFAGWLMGILAHEGERVREHQPLAWLRAL